MRTIVQYILAFCARKILKKFKPIIIGVTGSVGKTTARLCIAHVLKDKYKILQNIDNYNTEFGLPLSILGLRASKTKWGWINVLKEALKKAFKTTQYYEMLILEMGVDKPGDLKILTDIARPDISVVTNVENVHLQFFRSQDELAHEKATIIRELKKDGISFVNFDNDLTKNMKSISRTADIYTFGFDKKADIYASDVQNTVLGLKGIIHDKDLKETVHLPYMIGKHSMYNVLVAWGIATKLGIDKNDIIKSLKTFKGPQGRMNLIEGINHSIIIDSSYNAEPASMQTAIKTLKDLPQGKRRIAIIGDMLELGMKEKELHEDIGKFALKSRLDLLCFVGPRMKFAYDYINKQSKEYTRGVLYFKDSIEAAEALPKKIKKDDLILIKGSNGVKMNRILDVIKK